MVWRWLRRLLKLLGWTVLLVIIIVVAALSVLRTPGGQDWLRDTILSVAKKSLPGLSIGRIEGDYTSKLALVGVALDDRDGQPCASVARVEINLALGKLLGGVVRVDSIKIIEPRLWIRKRADGSLNLAYLVLPSKEPPKPEPPKKGPTKLPKLTVELGELHIENAVVALPAAMAPKSPEDGKPARVLSLDLKLSARAELPKRAKVDLSLRVGGLERNKPIALDLKVDGPLSKAKLALELVLGSHGKIDLRGTAGIDEKLSPSYDLVLALRDVGARALGAAQLGEKMAPNLPPSLSLKLSAAGRGIPTEPGAELRAGLDISPLEAAGAKLESLSLRAKLAGKQWTLDKLALAASGAKLDASGSGDFEQVKAKVALRVPKLGTLPLPGVKLRGGIRLDASVEGAPAGKLDASVDLRGTRISVNGKNGVASLRLRAKGKDVLRAPHGTLSLRAGGLVTGGKPAPVATVALDVRRKSPKRAAYLTVDAEGKDLAAKVGAAVSLPAKLADVSLAKIAVTLEKLQARQGKRVVSLEKPIRLRYDPSRPINLPGTQLSIFGGTVTVSGRFAPKGMPRLRAKVELRGVQPLPALPAISGTVEAEARRELTAKVRLALRRAGRVEIDARLPLRYRRGSPVPTLAKKPVRATVHIKRLDLARFRKLLGRKPPALAGLLDLGVDARGPLLGPDVDLKLRLARARFDKLSGAGAALDVKVRDKRSDVDLRASHAGHELVRVRARAPLDVGVAVAGLNLARLARLPLDVKVEVPSIAVKRLAKVHPSLRTLPETLVGKAKVDLTVKGSLGEPRLVLHALLAQAVAAERKLGDVKVELKVDGETNKTRARLGVNAANIDLVRVSADVDQPVLTLAKRYKSARLSANVAMPNIDLSRLARVEPKLKLAGRLDLAATASGKLLAPSARVTLGMVGVRFDEIDVGKLSLTASHDAKQGTKADFELRHSAGGRLVGKVRLDAKKNIDAKVTARKLRLAAVEKIVEAVRELDGTLDLDATATGKVAKPVVNANVKLDAKKLRLVGMSTLENIVARVRADPSAIVLEQLSVKSGGGKITGKARVTLDKKLKPRRFALSTNADKFMIGAGPVQGAIYSGTVDVDAKMPAGKREVDATVTLGNTSLKLPDELAKQRSLLAAGELKDVVFVDARAVKARKKEQKAARVQRKTGLSLDIKTKADPVFLRSKQIDAEAHAQLRTRISPDGTTRIGGFVAIRRGYVEIFDTRYSFDNARVAFNDSKRIDPALNLSLAANISDYRVYLGVQGTASKPALVLRSEPPLERAQIVNLILTGRLTARGGSGGSGAEAAVATAAASAVLKKIGVIDAVAGAIGLDVAKVNIDDVGAGKNKPKASAEFGKYLTRRVYIGGRVIIGAAEGENVAEGIFEYRISARWLLTAVFGDKGLGGLDALWTHRY
ncbi:MAG: translocation/assembly module TamB [Myxococcales bacterium]|nr:translocation/assembly module TamB [Myxococcales bacterium]